MYDFIQLHADGWHSTDVCRLLLLLLARWQAGH
jgi:hypothetical protein